jgi:hypothetical protein
MIGFSWFSEVPDRSWNRVPNESLPCPGSLFSEHLMSFLVVCLQLDVYGNCFDILDFGP